MSEQKPPSPSPQFIRSTKAAVAYWCKRTQKIDDDTIRQLDAERQNLFQAVQFGLTLPQTQHDTAMVALQTFDLVERKGYWREWISVLEQAVALCTKEQLLLKFRLLIKLGQLQRLTQQLSEAIETHQKAEFLAQQLGDRQIITIAYCNLGEDYLRRRKYAIAERYGRAALMELNELEEMEYWQAFAFNTLGEIARFRGDLSTSEEVLSQAVMIRRKLGQPIPLVRTLSNFAIVLQTVGKFNQALQCYEEASELLTTTSYELDKIMIQVNLGALYSRHEQWDKAETALRQIDFAYLSQLNKTYYEAAAMQSLGNVLLKRERPEEAIPYLKRSMVLWQVIGEELEQANSGGTLGEALVIQGEVIEATSLYQKVIIVLEKFPDDARAQSLLAEFTLAKEKLANKN